MDEIKDIERRGKERKEKREGCEDKGVNRREEGR